MPDGLPSHRPRGFTTALAIHLAIAGVLATAPERIRSSAAAPAVQLTIVPVSATEATQPPPPVLVQSEPVLAGDDSAADAAEASPLSAGFPFDIQTIVAHRDVLFPFLTAELAFLNDLRDVQAAKARQLRSPVIGPARRSEWPPLALSSSAMQALIDDSWSRRRRWPNMARLVELAEAHDPDEGQLPQLIRRYVDQNLLQPYVDGASRDGRFWTMLGLAADHVDVVTFVGEYVRRRPSSRASVELLFLLDELAQGSRDALVMLLGTDPSSELGRTRALHPAAFDLAVTLRSAYGEWLRRHGLDSPHALAAHFARVRGSILSAIIDADAGGYGAADARFLLGRALWDDNDFAGAVRTWQAMGSDERDEYGHARLDIRAALGPADTVNVVEVVRILGAERRRWLDASSARLRHFGYAEDTF